MGTKKYKTAIGSILPQLKKNVAVKQKSTKDNNNNVLPVDFLKTSSAKDSNHNKFVPATSCHLWKLKDRQKHDLGDIESLAEDIEKNGQIHPAIVRTNRENSYEIIVGERRWRACKLKNLDFLVTVKELSDQQALVLQAAENLNRKNLSDYSKGMSYHSLIKSKVITRTQLREKLGIPKSSFSELLSFAELPKDLMNKISNPEKITARVAGLIRSNLKKGDNYKEAIMSIANHLSKGIGATKFNALLRNKIEKSPKKTALSKKVVGKRKKHLFTIKNDGEVTTGFFFPKEIAKDLNFNKLEKLIKEQIEKQLCKD